MHSPCGYHASAPGGRDASCDRRCSVTDGKPTSNSHWVWALLYQDQYTEEATLPGGPIVVTETVLLQHPGWVARPNEGCVWECDDGYTASETLAGTWECLLTTN
jgi:hypothetical protein